MQEKNMSSENQFLAQRREKAESLAELNVKLYSNTFKPEHRIADILPEGNHLEAEQKDESGRIYKVAGRIMAMRKFGKAAFFSIADSSGQMQVYVKKDTIGEEFFSAFKKWDIGDIVGVKGSLFKTKTAETSVHAETIIMISKSLRPLPEKWHGLTDVETSYRQRYVDLNRHPGEQGDISQTY